VRTSGAVPALILILSLLPGRGISAAPPPPLEIGQPVQSIENPPAGPEYAGCGGMNVAVSNAAWEQQVFDLTNAERAAVGRPPLKRVPALDEAARYHAADMAQDGYFEHDSYDMDGSTPVLVCSWSTRISGYYTGWNYLAENIAAGYASPSSVVAGWMNSQGHKDNILSTSIWELGVGYFPGGFYGTYWVQDFGRRSGIYPLIINRDTASTSNPAVNLYIYNDNKWTEMRLRNDGGAWTAWLPYQASYAWSLPSSSGQHTVTAELRNAAQTTTSSDTIYLDAPISLLPRAFLPLLIR
jgi:uncharacterized protein YkwD